MESCIHIEDYLILLAFAAGFFILGAGITVAIIRLHIAWFLSLISVHKLRAIVEETGTIYAARWQRQNSRKGRHLVGVPLRRSASDEVREEFEGLKEPNESRKL